MIRGSHANRSDFVDLPKREPTGAWPLSRLGAQLFYTPTRAREGVARNVGLQTIKAAIEKAVMQRGSYP